MQFEGFWIRWRMSGNDGASSSIEWYDSPKFVPDNVNTLRSKLAQVKRLGSSLPYFLLWNLSTNLAYVIIKLCYFWISGSCKSYCILREEILELYFKQHERRSEFSPNWHLSCKYFRLPYLYFFLFNAFWHISLAFRRLMCISQHRLHHSR